MEELSSASPAAEAGLKPGDRVLSYDGKPLPSPAAFDALQQNTLGKKDVVLEVRRSEKPLSLIVPLGKLEIAVRPELPAAALTFYEDGNALLKAGKIKEAAARWEESGNPWLYNRAGEILEDHRLWKDAEDAHFAAWALLKNGTDEAAKSRTLSALGWCHENDDDLMAAASFYDQARQADSAAGNEMWEAGDLQTLGALAHSRGDLPAAQDYYNRALAIWDRSRPNSKDVDDGLYWLAGFAERLGDLTGSAGLRHSIPGHCRTPPSRLYARGGPLPGSGFGYFSSRRFTRDAILLQPVLGDP